MVGTDRYQLDKHAYIFPIIFAIHILDMFSMIQYPFAHKCVLRRGGGAKGCGYHFFATFFCYPMKRVGSSQGYEVRQKLII